MRAASKVCIENLLPPEDGLVNAHALMLIPTASDYFVNIYLLGVGLFLIIGALAICSYLLECLTRAFDATCNWLEYKLHRRKVRRRSLAYLERNAHRRSPINAPHPSPAAVENASAKSATVLPYKARRTVDAHEALRRSASRGDNQPSFPRGA
jgi:hypothetical protein